MRKQYHEDCNARYCIETYEESTHTTKDTRGYQDNDEKMKRGAGEMWQPPCSVRGPMSTPPRNLLGTFHLVSFNDK